MNDNVKVGLQKLLGAVEKDKPKEHGWHDYDKKLQWIINRAKQYAMHLNTTYEEVIEKWEEKRDYWYMNFYQECNQPDLDESIVHVYDDVEAFKKDTYELGYRCPYCNEISKDPQRCDSGVKVKLIDKNGLHECNWTSYGFLGTIGKGTYVLFKDKMVPHSIFVPIKFESKKGACYEKRRIG